MSRFSSDKLRDFNPRNLHLDDARKLLALLKRFVICNKMELNEKIESFLSKTKEYSICEVSDSVLMVLRKDNPLKCLFHAGYPFPIYTEDAIPEFKDKQSVKIDIHIRGEILRNLQRHRIISFLQERIEEVKWIPTKNISEFRKTVSSSIQMYASQNYFLLYVDPYEYIGDSIAGLYFIDAFKKVIKANKIIIFSEAYKHLSFFYESYPKDENIFCAFCQKSHFIVMPDLIDNHLHKTLSLINAVKNWNLAIFIVGRNLFIDFTNYGHTVTLYHLEIEDVLLRNKNIEEYMDECLAPFLTESDITSNEVDISTRYKIPKQIFINPHASHFMKTIRPRFALEVIERIIDKTHAKIYISKGSQNKQDKEWIKNFSLELMSDKYSSISKYIQILSDSGLADLCNKLYKIDITCALTTDTAISHLLSRMKIPNITLFNRKFWDPESKQSLSAESLLGFCRFFLPQYPAVIDENTDKNQIIEDISNGVIALSNLPIIIEDERVQKILEFTNNITRLIKKQENCDFTFNHHYKTYSEYLKLKKFFGKSDLEWVFNIYDPEQSVKGIALESYEKICYLVKSAWLILPLYKLFSKNLPNT